MPAAAHAQAPSMSSPVLLAQPTVDKVFAFFFAGLLVTALLFSIFTDYARHETVKGQVAAASGFSAVVSDHAGTVSVLTAQQGQRVRRGDVLAVVNLPTVVASDGDTAVMNIERMGRALGNVDDQVAAYAQVEKDGLAEIAQIETVTASSLASAQVRRALTDDRRRMAEDRLAGLERLEQKGFMTSVSVDQARAGVLQIRQEAADTDVNMDEMRRARADRLMAIRARMQDARQAAMALRTQRLQTENLMQAQRAMQSVRVVAPGDGVISAVSVRQGQRVEPGQNLLAVGRPDAALTVLLEAPSKAIGLIEAGQRVVLKYDPFPFQTFGVRYGRVVRVGQASVDGGAPPVAGEEKVERGFLVEVRPDEAAVLVNGRLRPLKVGMTLAADVEVERRSLLMWFLGPIANLKGRLS